MEIGGRSLSTLIRQKAEVRPVVPAILKGWFDRVWAPGVAYDHAADFGPIRPRLAALHRVLAITTLGAARWVDWLVLWRPVQRI